MESDTDIVRAFYIAIDQGDLNKAGAYLAEDFKSVGVPGVELMKTERLDVVRRLQEAMPNLKHALSNMNEVKSVVKITVQAGGRHTRPLDLSGVGMGIREGSVPGSGRVVIFQPDRFEYTILRGKIKLERLVAPEVGQGKVNEFLSALGVMIS